MVDLNGGIYFSLTSQSMFVEIHDLTLSYRYDDRWIPSSNVEPLGTLHTLRLTTNTNIYSPKHDVSISYLYSVILLDLCSYCNF